MVVLYNLICNEQHKNITLFYKMQAQKYPIKKWAIDDRPREKLLSKSPRALSNSELLAILLHHGTREKNAVELARELLLLAGNDLNELARLPVKDLVKVKGVGQAKAIAIAAALELGRRRQAGSSLKKTRIQNSRHVAHYLQNLLKDHPREVFAVMFLNRANKINHFEILSEGGITGTVADPRIILKRALEEDAVSIVLCHNHPSGNLTPSNADDALTTKIKEAARFFDIRVLDHIIVSNEGYYSFADQGRL